MSSADSAPPNAEVEALALRIAHTLAPLGAATPESEAHHPAVAGGATLADGYAGIALALMYAGECFASEELTSASRGALRNAAKFTAQHPYSGAGLYTGTAGLTWTIAEFTAREPRYLGTLVRTLDALGGQILDHALVPPGQGVPFHDFDVISGAAGQLVTLSRAFDVLDTLDGGQRPEAAVAAYGKLLDYLLDVTAFGSDGVPRWLTSPEYYPRILPWYQETFPHGMFNLGFAHGLPGALGALCRVAADGHEPARARVAELYGWLAEHQVADGSGPAWTFALQADPDTAFPAPSSHDQPARAAWCYGAPGIAATLFSVADVLEDETARALAEAALTRVMQADEKERDIYAPTLCHGHAGLAAVYQRSGIMSGDPTFLAARDTELAAVVSLADDRHAFITADEPERGVLAHDPGLLTGAAGVLLGLLGASFEAAATWDEVLFLTRAANGRNVGRRD
jgi:lantibiotic modifying enzyme